MEELPTIDLSPVVAAHRRGDRTAGPDELLAADAIDAACRRHGFFLVAGHGVPGALLGELDGAARTFFALDDEVKARVAMARGGAAWRGWFPEGGELTAGRPDRKEGMYFGTELAPDDPRVLAGTPLHGPNLFPVEPASLAPAVLGWMAAVEQLGHALARGVSIALGLPPTWFHDRLTAEPTVLFRIFRYPPTGGEGDDEGWGVAEHTDYGLLTLLAHDGTPGLEVRTGGRWLAVPAVPGTFVVNLGDMLERMTAGRYRSTPHRVRHGGAPGRDRLSFPLFFDPAWDAAVRPVPDDVLRAGDARHGVAPDDASPRWDGASVHDWHGTYGDYLLTKVAKVFPSLGDEVLPPAN